QTERDAKRLASWTAGAQPTGGRSSYAPLELGLACVERVAERRVPRELVAGNRMELEQPPQERLRALAREVAALDECDGVGEICERQPAGETRTVGALRRIGGRHELARSAPAQTTTPPQLLGFRHEGETRGLLWWSPLLRLHMTGVGDRPRPFELTGGAPPQLVRDDVARRWYSGGTENPDERPARV